MPGREYPVELVVDEMEGGDSFVPVSFSWMASEEDPARCVQAGESSSCSYTTETGQYTDWDSSEEPIPPTEFEIPAACYTDAGTAVPRSAKAGGRNDDGEHLIKLPWAKRPSHQ